MQNSWEPFEDTYDQIPFMVDDFKIHNNKKLSKDGVIKFFAYVNTTRESTYLLTDYTNKFKLISCTSQTCYCDFVN